MWNPLRPWLKYVPERASTAARVAVVIMCGSSVVIQSKEARSGLAVCPVERAVSRVFGFARCLIRIEAE